MGLAADRSRRSLVLVLVLVAAAAVVAGATWAWAGGGPLSLLGREPIRIGAVFPLHGNAASLAGEQLLGVRIAVDFANAAGGIDGRPLALEVRDLPSRADAPQVMAELRDGGVEVVVGAYASDLSVAASAAADAEGMVYWEAGAVADRLTARGLPLVFRVGASGANLGFGSATFAATELAPRLGTTAYQLRVAVVNADDDYARSVADAVERTAADVGMPIALRTSYDLAVQDWPRVMAELAASRPDVIVLASHIPDGVAFRRAMLAAGLRVGALIGTTMAQCDPDFAGALGPDAVGIFASDRPTGGFQPSVLDPAARAVYDRFATEWVRVHGAEEEYEDGHEYGERYSTGTSTYTIVGPDEERAGAGPTEEGLSGFTSAWVLLEQALPAAAISGSLDAESIAAAARRLDLPAGSLPNGAGVRFSTDPATLGQNERAAAVIWQWQAVRTYAFVWPPAYVTGPVEFVPLPR